MTKLYAVNYTDNAWKILSSVRQSDSHKESENIENSSVLNYQGTLYFCRCALVGEFTSHSICIDANHWRIQGEQGKNTPPSTPCE